MDEVVDFARQRFAQIVIDWEEDHIWKLADRNVQHRDALKW